MKKWGIAKHMRDAIDTVRSHIKNIDLVLEVRDARAPISTVNPELEALTKGKRRIVLLNKMDLAAPGSNRSIARHFSAQDQPFLCTSLMDKKRTGVEKLIGTCHETIIKAHKHVDIATMMVIGVPNCGKSTLINSLKEAAVNQGFLPPVGKKRFGGRARTAPLPGVTRHVSSFQVADRPRLFVLDTPGISVPQALTDIQGYRLALTGALPDAMLGEKTLVAFMAASLASPAQRTRLRAAIENTELLNIEAKHTMAELRDDFIAEEAERALHRRRRSTRGMGRDAEPSDADRARAVREISGSDLARSFPRPREFSLLRERLAFLRFVQEEIARPERARLARLEEDTQAVVEWVSEGPLRAFVKSERSDEHEGKEQALYVRLLKAYRMGNLGLYTLDALGTDTEAPKRPRKDSEPEGGEPKDAKIEAQAQEATTPAADLSLEDLRKLWKG